jgi:hypothetical protein
MRYGRKDYLTVHLIQRKGDEKLENGMNIRWRSDRGRRVYKLE